MQTVHPQLLSGVPPLCGLPAHARAVLPVDRCSSMVGEQFVGACRSFAKTAALTSEPIAPCTTRV